MKPSINTNHCKLFAALLVCFFAIVTSEHANETIEKVLSLVRSKAQITKERLTSDVFVTLAFAQSLDGKIAQLRDNGSLSSNLAVSGPDSLTLTHGLRSLHDGILIGRRTAKIDSPRLTNRLYESNTSHQPRPILLDPRAVLEEGAIIQLTQTPILVVAKGSKKQSKLKCDLVEVELNSTGELDLVDLLRQLRTEYGMRSIMVEGGAGTLAAFLREKLFDCICITMNPNLVLGRNGLSAFDDILKAYPLRLINASRIGNDLQLTFDGQER